MSSCITSPVGIRSARVMVTFAAQPNGHEEDTAQVTVSAPWVTSGMNIIVTPSTISTADHDHEDILIELMQVRATNVVPGVSFDVIAHAPNGTWGRYVFNAVGA